MPRIKLTEKAVNKLVAPDPSGKQMPHWDTEMRGFGVLCSGTTNVKTYIVQRDLPRTNPKARHGPSRRVTVAAVSEISLAKAREEAAEMLRDLRRGIDPKRKKAASWTLQEALKEYRDARKGLRPKSVQDYQGSVGRYLKSWLETPLRDITPAMVEQRHREIAVEVAAKHRAAAAEAAERHLARAAAAERAGWPEAAERHRARAAAAAIRKPATGHVTANGTMRVLRAVWFFAADPTAGRIPDLPPNPVGRLRRQWFPVRPRERLVSADDLPKFYQAVAALPNPVVRDYFILLLFTGLRRGEAAGLRWDDVDLRAGVIRIPGESTKSGEKLDLPMSDFLRDMLIARRAAGDAKFVFPANSKSGHVEEPKFALDIVAAATGIRVSPHDLRRTFITIAESTDISPFALKALVNHAQPRGDVTSGYIRMTPERLREPAQRVADRLKQLCGIAPVAGDNVAVLPGRK